MAVLRREDSSRPILLRSHREIRVVADEAHTQASFNTMRYKGRDSASGIDRKLLITRPGATTIVAP
jgi:hypothetical protein